MAGMIETGPAGLVPDSRALVVRGDREIHRGNMQASIDTREGDTVQLSVGNDILPWLDPEKKITLSADRLLSPDYTIHYLANFSETSEVFRNLQKGLSHFQIREARGVAGFEALNFYTPSQHKYEADLLIRNEQVDFLGRDFYRIDHNLPDRQSMSIFLTKARGKMANSRFFWTACRKANSREVLKELMKYGYRPVVGARD